MKVALLAGGLVAVTVGGFVVTLSDETTTITEDTTNYPARDLGPEDIPVAASADVQGETSNDVARVEDYGPEIEPTDPAKGTEIVARSSERSSGIEILEPDEVPEVVGR